MTSLVEKVAHAIEWATEEHDEPISWRPEAYAAIQVVLREQLKRFDEMKPHALSEVHLAQIETAKREVRLFAKHHHIDLT